MPTICCLPDYIFVILMGLMFVCSVVMAERFFALGCRLFLDRGCRWSFVAIMPLLVALQAAAGMAVTGRMVAGPASHSFGICKISRNLDFTRTAGNGLFTGNFLLTCRLHFRNLGN